MNDTGVLNMDGSVTYSMYNDQYGKPVKRTPHTHPYSYDSYVLERLKPNSEVMSGVYTDRLYQQDYKKISALVQKHCNTQSQYWNKFSAKQIQLILRDFLEYPNLEICYIMESCNQSSGFPLWYIAFKY